MARLVGSVTQGGADAFAQAEIQTALSGQTRLAYKASVIEIEIPRTGIVSGSEISVCLSRRTKTAMPLITDVDVIVKRRLNVEILTSGAFNFQGVQRFEFPQGIIIVEDPIYLIVDSTATTLTQTVYFAMEYELMTISELDRLTLLTQSLV